MKKVKKIAALVIAITMICMLAACEMPVAPSTTPTYGATSPSESPSIPNEEDHTDKPVASEPAPTTPSIIPTEPDVPQDDPSEPSAPVHTHEYSVNVVAPTCIQPGVTNYVCECGDSYTADELPAIGHKWSEWKTTVEATEDAEGEEARVCLTCELSETKKLPVIIPGHKHDFKSNVIKATCLSGGYTTHTCSCGDSYVSDEVPATGHKWSNWKTVTEPTTTKEGKAERICSNCKCAETKPIDKLPIHVHKYEARVVQKVSCGVVGIKEYVCSCGDSYTEKTSALEHSWSNWVLVEYPTTEKEGREEKKCSRCGKVVSNAVEKLPILATQEDAEEIAKLIVQYINEYRSEIGSGPMTMMEGCNEYAKLRSEQMAAKNKAEHNVSDGRAAATQLKYGYYVDTTAYGLPGDPYYYVNGSEAVGKDAGTTAENVAMTLATGFRNSTTHWGFIGASENDYIGVGVTLNNGYWYCCIIAAEVNLDENPNGF